MQQFRHPTSQEAPDRTSGSDVNVQPSFWLLLRRVPHRIAGYISKRCPDRHVGKLHWIFGPARSTKVQFFRYFWVGGISTVVDFAVFVFCVRVLGLHYLVAQFFAYCVGFVTNYILSILWVFQKTNQLVREITVVFIITMFGLLWTELLLYLFVDTFFLGEVKAKAIATIIVLFWNFGARRLIVYRNPVQA